LPGRPLRFAAHRAAGGIHRMPLPARSLFLVRVMGCKAFKLWGYLKPRVSARRQEAEAAR